MMVTEPDNKSSLAQGTDEEMLVATNYVPAAARVKHTKKPIWSWQRSLLVVAVITALAIIAFLILAKSVVIKLTPLSQAYQLSGALHITLGERTLMLPGDYQINATLTGYYPLQQDFVVAKDTQQQAEFVFTPLPGELQLDLNVDVPVEVLANGELYPNENGLITQLPAGEYQLVIKAENYFEQTASVIIEGKEIRQDLAITLMPAWADIRIISEPEGAKVFDQDTYLGITPLNAPLLQGEHTLKVEKMGFTATTRIVSVVASKHQELPLINLFPLLGELSVTSIPSGASVTLGEQFLGKTPLNVNVEPDKLANLRLFKEGFVSSSQRLVVPSGQKLNKHVQLKQVTARVNFKATPEDALIYINDRLMGRANQSFELPSSEQKIRIEKDGYVSHEQTLLPNPEMDQVVNISLKTKEQHRFENLPEFIDTELSGRLKLFKPKDTFTMGASRREQGRRANEVRKTVNVSRAFYMGTKEVTNHEFRNFLQTHSSGNFKGHSLNASRQPVVEVTWLQAVEYCNWLSTRQNLKPVYTIDKDNTVTFDFNNNGYRLPTEAEWVWSSRFEQGSMLKFPWGTQLPPKGKAGNYADVTGAPILGIIITNYNDGFITSAPVGSFAANTKGLFDLGGNVAEWLHDYYQIGTGLSMKVEKDPLGPLKGDYHVIRGSSWAHGSLTELRLSFRDYSNKKRNDLGFRIARNAF